MLNYKSAMKLFFILTVLISFLIVAVNYVVDPYQQYRKAKFYQVMFMNGTERYLNAGLAKTFPYDSVVIGSSMTQNFIISEVTKDLGFQKPIKLTVSGGNIFEETTILKTAIRTGKVENVLFGIDIMALPDAESRSQLPLFLYDEDIINDYKYLFNLDTFKRAIVYPVLPFLVSKDHPRRNYNLMYQWQHLFDESYFDAKKVLKIWRDIVGSTDSKKTDMLQHVGDKHGSYVSSQGQSLLDMELSLDKFLVPILERRQDINYIFFFPPYSILTYKVLEKEGSLQDFIKMKKYISQRLSRYPHVELYDFQTAKEITYNLNNYMDLSHYHQKVNTWMLEKIREKAYRVTPDNVDLYASELREQTISYSVPDLGGSN
jgi:hypothetical protein